MNLPLSHTGHSCFFIELGWVINQAYMFHLPPFFLIRCASGLDWIGFPGNRFRRSCDAEGGVRCTILPSVLSHYLSKGFSLGTEVCERDNLHFWWQWNNHDRSTKCILSLQNVGWIRLKNDNREKKNPTTSQLGLNGLTTKNVQIDSVRSTTSGWVSEWRLPSLKAALHLKSSFHPVSKTWKHIHETAKYTL